ncbi:Uncharacterised protein [Vibrio cholerae]|nr:Uncharacterised protein [Vibrio cholerae]
MARNAFRQLCHVLRKLHLTQSVVDYARMFIAKGLRQGG